MNKMLTHLNGYKREAVLAPLFKMLEATFDLFVPLVMADIVNVGIAAHDFHYILVRCGILLLLAVVGLACSLTAQYFSAKAAVGYSTSLRHALFEHIQRLGFTEMDTMGTSTLITRMTSDINQVQSGLNLFLRLFLRSPFVVVGAMVMAFTVNVRAAWIFVVAIPLLSVVVFGVMVITNPLYKTAQARLDRVLGLTRENLTGVRVVRAFDKEQDEIDRFENANDLLTKMQLHVGHLSALMSPLTYVIINIAIVALLYVGSIEINVGGMASGDVIALVNYMNQILIELVKLANLIVQVSKALACAGRVQAVLDTKPGMDFPAELRSEVPADKAGDAVRFDHVSLTYAGAGAPSLSDISFTAKRGQTIGVIGGTGSGKSTLANLIPRFYDATEGRVLIDGHDILEEPREAKRHIGYLPEIPPLYMDMTVDEYLRFVCAIKDVKKSYVKTHLDDITELIRITDVRSRLIKNLSKGYKQRVGIAQALIGNPDVLILDEPTVGLDPKQIIDIRNLIAQLGRTHTVILSSHILTEIEAVCERIIVINQGVLIADGTHEELSRHISEDMSLTAKIVGPPRQVLSALQRLAGVKGARALGARELGSTEFRIEPMPGVDVRGAIFDCAVAQGWKLLELTSNAMTLEEVFLKMVGQPPEEAAKLFGASGVAADPEQLDEDEALDPTEESAGPETDEAQTEKTADDGDAAMPDTEAKEGE